VVQQVQRRRCGGWIDLGVHGVCMRLDHKLAASRARIKSTAYLVTVLHSIDDVARARHAAVRVIGNEQEWCRPQQRAHFFVVHLL
jgi:hypothetical protein